MYKNQHIDKYYTEITNKNVLKVGNGIYIIANYSYSLMQFEKFGNMS